jgi:hypothetical protein
MCVCVFPLSLSLPNSLDLSLSLYRACSLSLSSLSLAHTSCMCMFNACVSVKGVTSIAGDAAVLLDAQNRQNQDRTNCVLN